MGEVRDPYAGRPDMNVKRYLARRRKRRPLHFTLLDPGKMSAAENGQIGLMACRAGTDAILVGGSTGMSRRKVDSAVVALKQHCKVPLILFPNQAATLSRHADAIFFMSMLNSRSTQFLINEQVRGAPFVAQAGLQVLPLGYLVVEPGMEVGRVGRANLISRRSPQKAAAYALAGQYLGMEYIYLEAGSGAPRPVPSSLIEKVRQTTTVNLVVGGGILKPRQAAEVVRAGADIVVTGTLVESSPDPRHDLKGLIEAVHHGALA